MKDRLAIVGRWRGHWTGGIIRPEDMAPDTPEEFLVIEQQLAAGKLPMFGLSFLPAYYKRTGQVEKLYALYLSHGEFLSQGKEKSAFLLEKKFTETGFLSDLELKELQVTTYDYIRDLYPGRWPDQERPEQLFAMIYASECLQHLREYEFKVDCQAQQSAFDRAEMFDPSCGLLPLSKFRTTVGEVKALRDSLSGSECAVAEQKLRELYTELIRIGEENSLWKHLPMVAHGHATVQFQDFYYATPPETRAEKHNIYMQVNQRYQVALKDRRNLDELRTKLVDEIGLLNQP
jgi:hypothetical protein